MVEFTSIYIYILVLICILFRHIKIKNIYIQDNIFRSYKYISLNAYNYFYSTIKVFSDQFIYILYN
jgi:hypothetical protein